MTKDFEVLADTPLRSEDFGEGSLSLFLSFFGIIPLSSHSVLSNPLLSTQIDKAINVGWGSKQTQFHGSAGKAAAAQPTSTPSPTKTSSSPDDDYLPRISWRGDGAHFSISTLDATAPSSSSSSTPTRRVIRTYSRTAILQSTSEPISGLEHQLAWQPSGSLIASTQRFGTFEGAGEGREGRHDVVFFERNGLRHGEFELREGAGKKRDGEGRGWEYRVRELSWNCDSSLLAVWIDGAENQGDIGSFSSFFLFV